MLGRGSKKHFDALVKKKPDLKFFYDSLSDHTLEDIDNTKFPKWVRKILRTEKEAQARKEQGYLTPEEIADKMSSNHIPSDASVGLVTEIAINCAIKCRFPIEVSSGDLCFFGDNYVSFNRISKKLSKEEVERIMGVSVKVGEMTYLEYSAMVSTMLNKRYN